MKSIPQGAATTVWAATGPELSGKGGAYLEDCQFAQPVAEGEKVPGYYAYAVDPELAERLWQESQRIVGQEFTG